jgi:hypothetical protein
MTTTTKLYIGIVIALGFGLLSACAALQAPVQDLPRYLGYLALAVFCSTLKVKLPGLTSNISLNFVFILIAIAGLSLPETVAMSAVGGFVQSVWKRRPKMVQVTFNVATLSLSAGLAFQVAHVSLMATGQDFLPVVLTVGAAMYFVANTFLVSGVLSLVESKPLMWVWKQTHLVAFPYYLAGSLMAGLISYSSRSGGWQMSLILLPAMFLCFAYYKRFIERLFPEQSAVKA